MNPVFVYWAWIASIYLIILTFKDFKNKMMIDDRHNWFMMGLSVFLLTQTDVSIWYILGLVVVIAGLNWFIRKFKLLGGADVSSLTWIFYGFGIISIGVFVWFAGLFVIILVLYYVFKAFIVKDIDKPTQLFSVFLHQFA